MTTFLFCLKLFLHQQQYPINRAKKSTPAPATEIRAIAVILSGLPPPLPPVARLGEVFVAAGTLRPGISRLETELTTPLPPFESDLVSSIRAPIHF